VQPTNTAKARTKQAFAGVCVLELIMDASRFGSVDTEIFIAYDAKHQIAAFLPPQELRELSWRQTAAGSAITAEDRKRYEEKGLTTTRGMKVLDTIRTLNHVLNHGFEDLSLATFRLPIHLLQLLPTGFVRIWDSATSCWVRVSSRPESSSGSQVAELPASILKSLIANRLGEIKTLLLTMDQAGWGWSAGHWLLGGFGIHGISERIHSIEAGMTSWAPAVGQPGASGPQCSKCSCRTIVGLCLGAEQPTSRKSKSICWSILPCILCQKMTG
jgi:hypothetical protein